RAQGARPRRRRRWPPRAGRHRSPLLPYRQTGIVLKLPVGALRAGGRQVADAWARHVAPRLRADRRRLRHDRIERAAAAPRSARRRDKSLKVTITLFDVDAGAAANVADHTYRNEVDAMQGLSELIDKAVKPQAAGARAAK